MEMVSGVISGVLILVALITFPFGLRARRRDLKEIVELGSQLEERTRSLVERVESLAEEDELAKPSAEPSAEEAYSVGYRGVDIKVEPRTDVFPSAKDTKTRLYTSEAFLEKDFCSFTKEFSLIGREEPLKVFKRDVVWGDVEETIDKGSNWYFPPQRYSLVDKELSYAG